MNQHFEALLLEVSTRAVECGEQGDCGTDPLPHQCIAIEAHSEACNALRAYVQNLTPAWRSEPPTEPGWYWCAMRRLLVVEVYRDGHRLAAQAAGSTIPEEDFTKFKWSGPIQPPQEKP